MQFLKLGIDWRWICTCRITKFKLLNTKTMGSIRRTMLRNLVQAMKQAESYLSSLNASARFRPSNLRLYSTGTHDFFLLTSVTWFSQLKFEFFSLKNCSFEWFRRLQFHEWFGQITELSVFYIQLAVSSYLGSSK